MRENLCLFCGGAVRGDRPHLIDDETKRPIHLSCNRRGNPENPGTVGGYKEWLSRAIEDLKHEIKTGGLPDDVNSQSLLETLRKELGSLEGIPDTTPRDWEKTQNPYDIVAHTRRKMALRGMDDWEGDVIYELENLIDCTTSDAQGIIMGQEMQHPDILIDAYKSGMTPRNAAEMISKASQGGYKPLPGEATSDYPRAANPQSRRMAKHLIQAYRYFASVRKVPTQDMIDDFAAKRVVDEIGVDYDAARKIVDDYRAGIDTAQNILPLLAMPVMAVGGAAVDAAKWVGGGLMDAAKGAGEAIGKAWKEGEAKKPQETPPAKNPVVGGYYTGDTKLYEVAEDWARKRGLKIPRRGTPAWIKMYETWARWAWKNENPQMPLYPTGVIPKSIERKAPYNRILQSMRKQYGTRKGRQVFYAWLRQHGRWEMENMKNPVYGSYVQAELGIVRNMAGAIEQWGHHDRKMAQYFIDSAIHSKSLLNSGERARFAKKFPKLISLPSNVAIWTPAQVQAADAEIQPYLYLHRENQIDTAVAIAKFAAPHVAKGAKAAGKAIGKAMKKKKNYEIDPFDIRYYDTHDDRLEDNGQTYVLSYPSARQAIEVAKALVERGDYYGTWVIDTRTGDTVWNSMEEPGYKAQNPANQDDEESPSCPTCGGSGIPLGSLGRRQHYKCRQCGMTFSHQINPSLTAAHRLADKERGKGYRARVMPISGGMYGVFVDGKREFAVRVPKVKRRVRVKRAIRARKRAAVPSIPTTPPQIAKAAEKAVEAVKVAAEKVVEPIIAPAPKRPAKEPEMGEDDLSKAIIDAIKEAIPAQENPNDPPYQR